MACNSKVSKYDAKAGCRRWAVAMATSGCRKLHNRCCQTLRCLWINVSLVLRPDPGNLPCRSLVCSRLYSLLCLAAPTVPRPAPLRDVTLFAPSRQRWRGARQPIVNWLCVGVREFPRPVWMCARVVSVLRERVPFSRRETCESGICVPALARYCVLLLSPGARRVHAAAPPPSQCGHRSSSKLF